MTHAVQLRLFKLRMFDSHCHVVASHDDRGEAIDLPGVDLRGSEAGVAFEAAQPFFEMLKRRGAGGELRAVSVHLERERVLATFEPGATDETPTVVRVTGDDFSDALSLVAPVVRYLADCAASRLADRRRTPPSAPALPTFATLTPEGLQQTSAETLNHYSSSAEAFWQGTRDHDVSQNVSALLRHLQREGPHTILDFGCGPGRDLKTFRDLGHVAVGLDGVREFVEMARAYSGCEVLLQDFLELDLPKGRFDGIFANAALFHVPSQELPRVLRQLHRALKDEGTLLSSNPHGPNREGWSGSRYGCFLDLDTFRQFMTHTGFVELEHYFRPAGEPAHRQPWLASVWRKAGASD